MRFPRNNNELDEIFKNACVPEVSEFAGEYLVDMLTILPSLRRFSHRKVFYSVDDKIVGHNLLLRNQRWGHFFLEEGVCNARDSLKVIIINYDRKENSFVSNKIRDQLRCLERHMLYLGRLNCLIMGRLYFLGYFSLKKILDKG